jgi:hypothetical protein
MQPVAESPGRVLTGWVGVESNPKRAPSGDQLLKLGVVQVSPTGAGGLDEPGLP